MKFVIAILIGLMQLSVPAATYYVATNGNNAADGSVATPWSNIWYAANTVAAGDTVIVEAGEYNEFVTNTVSGTSGNLITFSGQRGSGGEWLTIIDPSTTISNGWVAAAEIGAGVWKQTNMAFAVRELTINHKRVAFPYKAGDISASLASAFPGCGLTNGLDLLALSSSYIVTNDFGRAIYFWDGIEAMYCSTGSVCYLRLRDGSNPNGVNIRGSPNHDGTVSTGVFYPAINIHSNSYITWSNVLVRGAFAGFYLNGGSANNVSISSNYIAGGLSAVIIQNGASNNVVLGNTITCDYYGTTNLGAWENGGAPYDTRHAVYEMSKNIMGGDSSASHDDRVDFNTPGNTNLVMWNHIFSSIGSGVTMIGNVSAPTWNTEICSNSIQGHPSVGILLSEGCTQTSIHHNFFSDGNINVRCHHWDTGTETNRVIYLYRNTLWLTNTVGDHLYFHFNNDDGMTYYPTLWCYHNSFSGGRGGITASSYAPDQEGLKNCFWLDNVFSGTKYYFSDYSTWVTNNLLGAFDWNMTTPPVPNYVTNYPSWFGTNNIKSPSAVWNTNTVPDFRLPDGSPAINAALDLTQSFAIGGTNYSALPRGSEVKVGPAWDMGALEAGYVGNMTTLRVGTLRGP